MHPNFMNPAPSQQVRNKYSGDYTKSRALIGLLSSDDQPIITSTNKMAASCWRAFDEINFFRVLQCFLFSFLE